MIALYRGEVVKIVACHLRYDAPHHVLNAARTRRQKRIASGQIELEL